MFYQTGGRIQRPKGFKIKRAFQIGLLLAVCIWLLYQVKHSDDKRKNYGVTEERRIIKEYQTIDFGRKGNAGISDGVESISDDKNAMDEGEKKEDGGDGDDELDRSAENRAEEESLDVGHEDSGGSVTGHEGENVKEIETEDESQRGGEDTFDTQVKDGNEVGTSDEDERNSKDSPEENVNNHQDEGGEKDPNRQDHDDSQGIMEDDFDTQRRDGDEAMGSDKDEKETKNSAEENVTNDEEKEDEKVTNGHEKESQANEKDNVDTQLRIRDEAKSSEKDEKDFKDSAKKNITNDEDKRDEIEPNRQQKESQVPEKDNVDTQQRDGDEATRSDSDQDPKENADEMAAALPPAEGNNTSVPDQTETKNGVGGYEDVNGVPHDGFELVNSSPYEKNTSLNQETVSGSDNHPGRGKNTTLVTEEVAKSYQLNGRDDREVPTDDKVIGLKYDEGNRSSEAEAASNSSQRGTDTDNNTDGEPVRQYNYI